RRDGDRGAARPLADPPRREAGGRQRRRMTPGDPLPSPLQGERGEDTWRLTRAARTGSARRGRVRHGLSNRPAGALSAGLTSPTSRVASVSANLMVTLAGSLTPSKSL